MDQMKENMPLGTDADTALPRPETEHTPPPSDVVYTASIKKRAKAALNDSMSDNRLTLVLALIVTLCLGVAVFLLTEPLLVLAELSSASGAVVAATVLWVLYALISMGATILLTCPLLTSVYRMAVLMMNAHGTVNPDGTKRRIGLGELFYPLTSASAYGRTLFVTLRSLGCCALFVGPAAVIVIAAAYGISALSPHVIPLVVFCLWLLAALLVCASLWLAARWTARLSGLAYMVFSCPDVPIGALRQEFRARRRSPALPLWMLLSFAGPALLAFAAVMMPLLLHTGPYMLLSWADMSRFLWKKHESETAEILAVAPAEVSEEDTVSTNVNHITEVA